MQQVSRLVVITFAVVTLMNKRVVCLSTALSNAERRTFLAEHNRWRSLVKPPPGDMLKMVYNVRLEPTCAYDVYNLSCTKTDTIRLLSIVRYCILGVGIFLAMRTARNLVHLIRPTLKIDRGLSDGILPKS